MLIFLTFMDILLAILMLLNHFDVTGLWRLNLVAILYIAGKFILFRDDPSMLIDAALGVYFIFLMFGVHFFMTWVFLVYLLIKIFLAIMPK